MSQRDNLRYLDYLRRLHRQLQAEGSAHHGLGQKLQALLNAAGIRAYVENCADCGRSSKRFTAEKRLRFIELCLRKGETS